MKTLRKHHASLSHGIFGALVALSCLGCDDGGDLTPMSAQSASTSACAAGSELEDSDLGTLSCQLGVPVQDVDPALQDELHHALVSYAQALQSGDVTAVAALLSAELQARIDERGQGADFMAKLHGFVRSEARKLSRDVGVLGRARESMTVTSARMLADGSIAAIRVAVAGRPVPKPFYFVQEDGGYKLNVIKPDDGFVIQSSYLVENGDFVNRWITCSGSGWNNVAAQASMYIACDDSCPTLWDGTRFTTNLGSADCDYNTWGIDVQIKNGVPVCNDPC